MRKWFKVQSPSTHVLILRVVIMSWRSWPIEERVGCWTLPCRGWRCPAWIRTTLAIEAISYARYPSVGMRIPCASLQNALSRWCAHYGHSHASAQLNCGILLDCPARLPLFNRQDKALMCVNCNTFPVDAVICLICGTTVCLQSNCCIDEDYNNRGECNMHTREYVCLSLSVLPLSFFLLDVAELSEYIIVSCVVSQFEYWNFYTITLQRCKWWSSSFDEVFLFYHIFLFDAEVVSQQSSRT